jgi:hypothetical protein
LSRLRIVTLLARHGTAKYPTAAIDLEALFRRTLPGVSHALVLIDNSLPADHQEPPQECRSLIGGDNRAWEFSAWDRGLAWLGPRLADFDLIHLATSAFGALHAGYLERFSPGMLARIPQAQAAGRPMAVGHIDFYPRPITVLGHRSRHWLRSSYIFLTPATVRGLGTLTTLSRPAGFFSGNPTAPFLAEAPLSGAYRRYILDWLTGPGTGQGTLWHSRFTLSAETLALFEAKTTAILNEHLLSIRLREQGCTLADATWLAGRSDPLLPPIPPWPRQLAARSVEAVRVPSALGCLLAPLRRAAGRVLRGRAPGFS